MLSQNREPEVMDASITRKMADTIRAFRISQIIGTIAQLEIPDRLAGDALTAGELASLSGCHAGATYRLMRAARELGLVASGPDARYTLTALGQTLRSDVPGSVRDTAIAFDLSWTLAAMGKVERGGAHRTTPDSRDARHGAFSILF